MIQTLRQPDPKALRDHGKYFHETGIRCASLSFFMPNDRARAGVFRPGYFHKLEGRKKSRSRSSLPLSHQISPNHSGGKKADGEKWLAEERPPRLGLGDHTSRHILSVLREKAFKNKKKTAVLATA